MKNYLKTILVCCVVGALSTIGTKAVAQNVSGNVTYVLPNSNISVAQNTSVDLDFTRLNPGTHAFIEMFDTMGKPFIIKVEKLNNKKLEVSVNTASAGNLTANTSINFIGKDNVVRPVNLTEISNQRCGLWCVIAHICCVHVIVESGGTITWKWSCSNCQPGME